MFHISVIGLGIDVFWIGVSLPEEIVRVALLGVPPLVRVLDVIPVPQLLAVFNSS